MKVYLKLSTVMMMLIICSCAETIRPNNVLIMRLKNRGPVPLSVDNPYLAANTLLTKEMETSGELRGFLKHRGAPSAIEVNKDVFKPLTLLLYYPDKREYYDLEDTDGAWLINGPYRIDRLKLSEIEPITKYIDGQPQLSFPKETEGEETGRDDPFADTGEREELPIAEEEPIRPLPTKAPVKRPPPPAPKIAEDPPAPVRTPPPVRSAPEITPQEAIANVVQGIIARNGPHPAELTPKGDLVHYVLTHNETLNIIARWYTYDPANAERLARINRMKPGDRLTPGDLVIIPSYLVRNKSRLTEAALGEMGG